MATVVDDHLLVDLLSDRARGWLATEAITSAIYTTSTWRSAPFRSTAPTIDSEGSAGAGGFGTDRSSGRASFDEAHRVADRDPTDPRTGSVVAADARPAGVRLHERGLRDRFSILDRAHDGGDHPHHARVLRGEGFLEGRSWSIH